MKLQYSLTAEDFIANAICDNRTVRLPFGWLSWVVWIAFLVALLLFSDERFAVVLIIFAVAFTLFQIVAKAQRYLWLRQYYTPAKLLGLAGDQEVEITPEHLRERAPNRDVTWQWQEYSTLYETPSHIFIRPTPVNSVIIPKRVLSSETEVAELVALVARCCREARGGKS
jgi:hypothetical protein